MQPVLEGDVMTVAQQWEQKGMQKGAQQNSLEIAKNMLLDRKADDEVIRYTGITAVQIQELKKNIKH